MNITADSVKQLRERTGAGMMECKKALVEANGDLEAAAEIMRKSGLAKADKKAARIAAEGRIVYAGSADGTSGVLVEVNCETDFVAKNEDFLAFAADLASLVAKSNPADTAALAALPLGGTTVEETRKRLVGKIGENLSIRRFARIEAKGRVAHYIHGGAKIGVLVDVSGGDEQLARDIAMHIAASKPVSMSRDEVPPELIKKERDIAAAKAAESGKPANIVEKMVEGSVQKYLKEITLMGQLFVKDDKQTIESLLKSRQASISRFVLFVVGEGIEKKTTDFAAEVLAQANQATRA